jgi:pimeloyl-ACP methyl ester carboxylesterase
MVYLHSAAGETEWMPFHEELALSHSVVLPAHPGFALSEGLERIDNMTDLAWHTLDLLDCLNLGRVPWVGFSLGAWLAVEMAILRPERVSALVLTAAAGLRIEEAPVAEIFLDDLDALRRLIFLDPDHPQVSLAMPLSRDDDRILHWIRAREATARLGWNPYLHNPKLPAHLRRIACPALVIWGRHDRLIPLAHGQYYASHIPGARLEILDDCGHMVPFENGRHWARKVTEFLQS